MKRLAVVALAACGHAAPRPPPAPAVCDGPLTITSQDELDALGQCPTVRGDVTIRGAAALDFRAVAKVEAITGTLMIGPTFAVDSIAFEGLREVDKLRVVSNGLAGGVYLPRLERVPGMIEIAANIAIAQVAMPALVEVKGDLIIEQNPSLEILDLGALAQVGGVLQLRNDTALTVVGIGALAHVGSLDLTGSAISDDDPLRAWLPKSD